MTAKRTAPAPRDERGERLIHVYPHPSLAARGEYLAGIGVDGADVSQAVADELLATERATLKRPARPVEG